MRFVKFGDILSVEKGFIVHGCNAQGVMGAGIAKQIKDRWPHVYEGYRKFLLMQIKLGQPLGKVAPVEAQPGLYIFNAITQDNFGRSGRYVNYEAVQKCFDVIASLAAVDKQPVHYPMIGAGLGGGDWSILSKIIDCAFEKHPEVDHTLWIFEP